MAVTRIFWADESVRDLHVLAGPANAFSLDHHLVVDDDGTTFFVDERNDPAHASAGITGVTFLTNVLPTASTGVTVDPATGKVEATVGPSGWATKIPLLSNFIVTATVVTTSGSFQHKIRVHIHETLLRVWLTPTTLSVPQGVTNCRFGLRGEFSDGVVGDLSEYPGITWASDPPGWGPLNTTTGEISSHTVPVGSTRDVTVTMPPKMTPVDPVIKGTALVKPSWGSQAGALTHAAGSAKKPVDTVHNILFLPDGFTAGEDTSFRGRVDKFIEQIGTMSVLRPWNMVKGRMNFFTAFAESREVGTSVLFAVAASTVLTSTSSSLLLGTHIPNPLPPTSPTESEWELQHMIHELGLCNPVGRAYDPATQRSYWQTLYGKGAGITDDQFWAWYNLADWVVPDETDTALGLAIGTVMSAVVGPSPTLITFHPFRTQASHLESWYGVMNIAAAFPPIGRRWQSTGADEARVVVFAKGATDCGTRGEVIAVSLSEQTDVNLTNPTPGSKRAAIAGWPYGTHHSLRTVATIVHELGHRLSLGDEYSNEARTLPASETATIEDNYTNLHAHDTIFSATGDFQAANLKWAQPQWLRIAACGVCAAPPIKMPLTDQILITLRKGDEAAFTVDEVVRLRHRDIFASAPPSGWFSPPMRIVEKSPPSAPNSLLLEWEPPRTDTAAQLVPFATSPSVLVRIVSSALFGDRPVVHPAILAHLTATDFALNVSALRRFMALTAPGSPPSLCVNDRTAGAIKQTPLNLPTPFLMPGRYPSWTVGIYEGGAEYSCGIYHPAGVCVMNGANVPRSSHELKGFPYRFCAVCRYILVEKIDPYLHQAIDDDYKKFYPLF